jgi:hypothetical protein
VSLAAQVDSPRTRSELLNELSLRKAQVALDLAIEAHERYENEYEDSQRLFDQSIISKKELDSALSHYTQAQQQLEQARITLEETQLGFLDNATHITILEAKKYYDPNGRRMLDLVLKNTSNLNQAEAALVRTDPNGTPGHQWQNPESIRALLDIENIIVSIVDQDSSIGKPYELIVPMLSYNDQAKLSFNLLTDVQQAGIRLQYLDKDQIEKITLEKESLQTSPTVVASQLSLEGQLGQDIGYDLSLEMLVTTERVFSLAVTNMPPQINCFFVEGSRITNVRFSEQVSTHTLSLKASIPDKLETDWIDKRIGFQVWVVTASQAEAINQLKRQFGQAPIPSESLDTLTGSRVDLTLIPKGSGRLEILVNSLYQEIQSQQDVSLEFEVHNDGTLALFNVIPEITTPIGWQAEITPKVLDKLMPNEKRAFLLSLHPGTDVGLGEYETRIEVRGQSGSETIEALDKRLKVRINAQANVILTACLIGGLVLLIVVIVGTGVRLSRK